MTTTLAPASIPELVEAVRSHPRVLAVGAGTKPRLSAVDAPVRISTGNLRGIIEYEPAEFTFTALAGTPLSEISEALAARGQYLPFDPMLVDAGATLGGSVASGLSGPGRFHFGGIRDFILGVRFVDGAGRLLRLGGKVVKNAAGFDLPKFLVGSLGRYGVLAEMTFKVFPRPASTLTLSLDTPDLESAARMLIQASNSRWEPEALDLAGDGGVRLRLSGPAAAITQISREILNRWPGQALGEEETSRFWSDIREFRWAHPNGVWIKVPVTLLVVPAFMRAVQKINDARWHVSAGGNLAFASLPEGTNSEEMETALNGLKLSGLTLRGDAPLWWGPPSPWNITRAVKKALDPAARFPEI